MAATTHDSHHHGPGYYIKIYFWLLLLLIASIIGPELGIRWVTLVTAFGIAIVKALIVAAYFMHLNIEKKYISYMLYTMLLLMGLFYVAVAPDVLHTYGSRWRNTSAEQLIQQHAKPAGDSATTGSQGSTTP